MPRLGLLTAVRWWCSRPQSRAILPDDCGLSTGLETPLRPGLWPEALLLWPPPSLLSPATDLRPVLPGLSPPSVSSYGRFPSVSTTHLAPFAQRTHLRVLQQRSLAPGLLVWPPGGRWEGGALGREPPHCYGEGAPSRYFFLLPFKMKNSKLWTFLSCGSLLSLSETSIDF